MRAPRLDVNPTKCVDRAWLPVCPTRSVFVLICPPGAALARTQRGALQLSHAEHFRAVGDW
jgi:hypothetical protein